MQVTSILRLWQVPADPAPPGTPRLRARMQLTLGMFQLNFTPSTPKCNYVFFLPARGNSAPEVSSTAASCATHVQRELSAMDFRLHLQRGHSSHLPHLLPGSCCGLPPRLVSNLPHAGATVSLPPSTVARPQTPQCLHTSPRAEPKGTIFFGESFP